MIQRISGYLRGMIALGPLPLRPVLGIILSCVAAEAGMENVRFAMHRKDAFSPTKTIPYLCDNPATPTVEANYSPLYTLTTCWSYNDSYAPLGASQVYIVVVRGGGEGVMAASFGIDYEGRYGQHSGIDPALVQWTSCTDGFQFTNDGGNGKFPKPSGGIRITWNTCQKTYVPMDGVDAIVGSLYVYAYSDDLLRLTPNNNLQDGIPELAVADCTGKTTDLISTWGTANVWRLVGTMGFGSRTGYGACSDVFEPTLPKTWGALKRLYREEQVEGNTESP